MSDFDDSNINFCKNVTSDFWIIVMYDKLDIRIPFLVDHLKFTADGGQHVNSSEYSFPLNARIVFMSDGLDVDYSSSSYDSLSSSISSVAMGFFPMGDGFYNRAHVRVKCSPAKILQGHNCFGSDNNLFLAFQEMVSLIHQKYEDIYLHLDFSRSEILGLDCTYSAVIESELKRKTVIAALKNYGRTDQNVYCEKSYCLIGAGSRHSSIKVYEKYQELLSDIEEAKKRKEHSRLDILQDGRLHDYARNLLRFEAVYKNSGLKSFGIPTLFYEYLKFEKWHNKTYSETLCKYLWNRKFSDVFQFFEGQKMNLLDDDVIKLKIENRFNTVSENGVVSRRLSQSLYRTYLSLKYEGYENCSVSRMTMYRHLKMLSEIGLSKAFLKNMKTENNNVVPFLNVIDVDFSNQLPFWADSVDDSLKLLRG